MLKTIPGDRQQGAHPAPERSQITPSPCPPSQRNRRRAGQRASAAGTAAVRRSREPAPWLEDSPAQDRIARWLLTLDGLEPDEFHVLIAVHFLNKTIGRSLWISRGELGRAANVDQQTLSRVLDQLADRELLRSVRRSKQPDTARYFFTITGPEAPLK